MMFTFCGLLGRCICMTYVYGFSGTDRGTEFKTPWYSRGTVDKLPFVRDCRSLL